MARLPLLSRKQRPPVEAEQTAPEEGQAAPAPEAPAPPPPPRRPPQPGMLRRERRALARAREDRIRDLGGLMLEMHRRDRLRVDLLEDQCVELLSIEARMQEIDGMLVTTRQQVQAARCTCGAPIIWGSHFCPNCGRPWGAPIVQCASCGHALPADAQFCANCGTHAPVPVTEAGPEQSHTAVESRTADETTPPDAAPAEAAESAAPEASPDESAGWQAEPAGEAAPASESAPDSWER